VHVAVVAYLLLTAVIFVLLGGALKLVERL